MVEVKIYKGRNEVLVFPVLDGYPVGEEDFFENGGRSRDDYDVDIDTLPLQVKSSISAWF